MNGNISVVIAYEHRIFREGLRLILDRGNGIQLIGEAANGMQAVDVISRLCPHVALLGNTLPPINGLEVIHTLRQKSPDTKSLLLTTARDEVIILKALKVGAYGYISKDSSTTELFKAIQVVHGGQLWVGRKITARFFEKNRNDSQLAETRADAKEALTRREKEVLRLLSKGFSNKEIANHLFISDKTVKCHLNSIFRKLNVTRRLQAILYAIRHDMA